MPIKQSKFYWKLVWRLLVRVSIWEWYSIWFQLRAVLISEDFIFLSNMWNNPYKPLRILSKNSIFKCFFDDFIQTSMKVARMCPSLSIEWLVLAKYSWIIWRHLRFWYGEQRFLQENCMPSYLSRCFTGSPLKKKVLSYIYIPNLYITIPPEQSVFLFPLLRRVETANYIQIICMVVYCLSWPATKSNRVCLCARIQKLDISLNKNSSLVTSFNSIFLDPYNSTKKKLNDRTNWFHCITFHHMISSKKHIHQWSLLCLHPLKKDGLTPASTFLLGWYIFRAILNFQGVPLPSTASMTSLVW